MYRKNPFRSTLNTGYITALDICGICTEAVHCVALFEHGLHHTLGHVWRMYWISPLRSTLNTGYITALDMCDVCMEAVHSVALWTRGTSHLWTCVKYVPKQSNLHHSLRHVWSMYRNSPLRSTLNTGYITALDMCEVCTEALHCVALRTRVTSQLWTCVKYVPKQSTA